MNEDFSTGILARQIESDIRTAVSKFVGSKYNTDIIKSLNSDIFSTLTKYSGKDIKTKVDKCFDYKGSSSRFKIHRNSNVVKRFNGNVILDVTIAPYPLTHFINFKLNE